MMLGVRATARELGISHPGLLKHESRGAVPKRNADGLFDVEACRAALAKNSHPAANRAQPATPVVVAMRPTPAPPRSEEDRAEQTPLDLPAFEEAVDDSITAIQRQRELIKLERERIGLQAFRGTFVDAEKVKTAVTARADAEREALLNWPTRISGELAAELNVDERTLYAALEKQVRIFLRERSRVGSPVTTAPGTGADA